MSIRDGHAARGARMLIVDDDPFVRESLREILEHDGYVAFEAGDGKTALELLDHEPVDLLLLDLDLPRVSGMTVLQVMAERALDIPVIIISGTGTIPAAIATMRLGAYDFIEKPLDAHRTMRVVRGCIEQRNQHRVHMHSLGAALERYEMCGTSPPVQAVYASIDQAARSRAKVLLIGESGTGKELAAKAIHHLSARAPHPFVTMNCAAIPETLIESELFGHTEGAFTGARRSQRGRIEEADRGTLFLDEIGDMSLMTQAKMLRTLESGEWRRVGGERVARSDFRLITATNKDLLREIEEGNFREDLYYRLSVVTIRMPALRERRDDIPDLTRFFARLHAERNAVPLREFTPAAHALLAEADWPGNVRQLSNVVEQLMVQTEGAVIDARDVARALSLVLSQDKAPDRETLRSARDRFEREYIRAALLAHEGQIQRTADVLGINRSHLWKKIRRLDIETNA